MIARGLHHRLEGRGEHILDEHVALRMRAHVDHAYLTSQRIDRAVTLASQPSLSSSSGLFRRQATTICGFSAA